MILVLVACIIIGLDQITKYTVSNVLSVGESVPVISGFFNITLIHNPGAAFGLFPNRHVFFLVFSCITFILITKLYFQYARTNTCLKVIFGLIVGGACGNLIDRVLLKYVIDFLDFYILQYHWPAFNVADSAICVGVSLFCLFFFRYKPQHSG
ncbi:signal peptidase II [bacterium]|nr:signal peptidase II [bacterium]